MSNSYPSFSTTDNFLRSCTLDISPPPPSAILNFTITVADMQQPFESVVEIHEISLQWTPPLTPNTDPASLRFQFGIGNSNPEEVLELDAIPDVSIKYSCIHSCMQCDIPHDACRIIHLLLTLLL